jgi:hypothetical protein
MTSLQKVLIRAKQFFLLKNSIWGIKNVEFQADFKSVEKFLKNYPLKVLSSEMDPAEIRLIR